MSPPASGPLLAALWELFIELRRRRFALGPGNYTDLHQALGAGFGWESPAALRDLLSALWAKSPGEQQTLAALYDGLMEKHAIESWQLPAAERPRAAATSPQAAAAAASQPGASGTAQHGETSAGEPAPGKTTSQAQIPPAPLAKEAAAVRPKLERSSGLPEITLDGVKVPDRHFIYVPDYPLSFREVAQAWRRLRQPVREGPPVELDVRASLERRLRQGVSGPVVLRPRRRNTARLLLLVDRGEAMTPFLGFVDEVCRAIQHSGNLQLTTLGYFRDQPAQGAPERVLRSLTGATVTALDPVLAQIEPLQRGRLYTDARMRQSILLAKALDERARGAAVAIVSDGGAASRSFEARRLLNTLAFLKALRLRTTRIVWLNPLPHSDWQGATAGQIARHIPMFPLDRPGLYAAVDVLRGRPAAVERPL